MSQDACNAHMLRTCQLVLCQSRMYTMGMWIGTCNQGTDKDQRQEREGKEAWMVSIEPHA